MPDIIRCPYCGQLLHIRMTSTRNDLEKIRWQIDCWTDGCLFRVDRTWSSREEAINYAKNELSRNS